MAKRCCAAEAVVLRWPAQEPTRAPAKQVLWRQVHVAGRLAHDRGLGVLHVHKLQTLWLGAGSVLEKVRDRSRGIQRRRAAELAGHGDLKSA